MSSKNQNDLGGMLSDKVKLRKKSDRIELVNPRKRKLGPMTPKLEAFRERFEEAAQYGSDQIADKESKELYATGIDDKKRNAFLVAVSDYIIPPRVKSIDAESYNGDIGSTVLVKAVDDFMVTKVKVVITDAEGSFIEEGEATQVKTDSKYWSYTATVVNPSVAGTAIKATAFDRPGNATALTKVL